MSAPGLQQREAQPGLSGEDTPANVKLQQPLGLFAYQLVALL